MLVYRSALIAALGGLLFGFDTAVISGTVSSLKKEFFLNDWWLGLTVASALIGTILGAATAQFPSNRFGRKPTLILIAAVYLISAVGTTCFWNLGTQTAVDWWLFVFFRFIGGLAIGASSVVCPLYTAEIAPAKKRGLLVAFTQFNIVFGILLAFFTNYLIVLIHSESMAGSAYSNALGAYITAGMEWRWMLGIEAIPAALFFLLLFTVPESPRWQIGKGHTEKAKATLKKLGTNEGRSVEEELNAIHVAIEEETHNQREAFFTPRLWFPISLAICMAAFNQLSGINAVLYYAPMVFSMAGAGAEMAMFLPVVIGLTNLVFTMVAMAIIDSFGRKKLMIVGSIGYITSLAVVAMAFMMYAPQFSLSEARQSLDKKVVQLQSALDAASDEAARTDLQKSIQEAWVDYALVVESVIVAQSGSTAESATDRESLRTRNPEELNAEIETKITAHKLAVPMAGILTILIGLMVFIASHAVGQGACIWVFIGEIFPQKVRAHGQALGASVHWILAATISFLFPPLLAILGPTNIFLMFAGFMVLQLLWVLTLMPETKQVPLEEMQKKLGIK